jgi:SET domain-containing protein
MNQLHTQHYLFSLLCLLYSAPQAAQEHTMPSETDQTACGGNQYSYKLQVAPGKGIGVFAVRMIPAGAPLSDRMEFEIKLCKQSEVPAEFQGHCSHLAGDQVITPARFDHMPIFWYLNHSTTPNVTIPDGISVVNNRLLIMRMYALKNIEAGEELTVDYNQLGEPEEKKEDFYRKN